MSLRRTDLSSYSVLMAVYDKELPENLNDSLDSMLMQTYPPDEVVLVCDGDLTNELNIIAKSFQSEYRSVFRIVRTDGHVGAGAALNKGIEACTCEYIIKMDSDDTSYPDRCYRQMKLFADDPELDMVGTFAEVYDIEERRTIGIKQMPTKHDKIMKYARRRNPFCRQSLAFRREKALEIGGYKAMDELEECEDYEFAVRMLQNGAKARNIPDPLVRYRISSSDYARRKSLRSTKSFIRVRKMIRKSGFSSLWDVIVPSTVQLGLFILPVSFTKRFYTTLRKTSK